MSIATPSQSFEEEAKALLETRGYVVLREKSYRKAREQMRTAEVLRQAEAEAAEHAREWGRRMCDEQRAAWDRATYLYGLAARYGASSEELHPWEKEQPVEEAS